MKQLLYGIVDIIAKIHASILTLNDAYEYHFSDKELHFLVIGLLGLGLVFVLYPVFGWLAKRKHEMVITWIYVFTVLIVLTFAIEIGQNVTNTGIMDFADIMFGLAGFIAMFGLFLLLRAVCHLIRDWIVRKKPEKNTAK